MPDPSMDRNRQLKRIADAQEDLVKHMKIFNQNMVAIGKAIVPAAQQLQQVFEMITEAGADENSTDTQEGVTADDIRAHKFCTETVCAATLNIGDGPCPVRDGTGPGMEDPSGPQE